MTTTPRRERLYQLLPAVYRMRDADRGEVLRALLAVVDEQLAAIDDDIGLLYESWFIETCPAWLVPYHGDLVGFRGLNRASPRTYSPRRFVANLLAYRRRKGTAAMLEQLARDVTGWPSHVTEYFLRVGTTQHMNHVRIGHHRTPDLRASAQLGLLGSPFDPIAHTADVRRIGDETRHERGRHNVPNLGVFLWRLETALVDGAEAAAAADAGAAGFYRFSPLGQDAPLWNRDRAAVEDITELSSEATVPGKLRRRALDGVLAALRRALEGAPPAPRDATLYFGAEPVFTIRVGGVAIPPEAMVICNLQDWHRPPATVPRADGGTWPIQVAVDPVLGRFALAEGATVTGPVLVGYYEAHVARLGGGGYPRRDLVPTAADLVGQELEAARPDEIDDLGDTRELPPDVSVTGGTTALATAVAAITGATVIELADSRTYALSAITVPANARVVIRARDRARPIVQASGASLAISLAAGSLLVLDGLLFTGAPLAVSATGAAALAIAHCTLVPGGALTPAGQPTTAGARALTAVGATDSLLISLRRSISGPLAVDGARLYLQDSIIDRAGGTAPAVAAPTATVTVMATTVFGATVARRTDLITDSILFGPLTIERNQEGCLRFTYLPDDASVAPPGYRCQPALALQGQTGAAAAAVRLRLRPTFTETRYGQPGYGQLADDSDVGIRAGASDESELGAFQLLQAPHRLANLRSSFDEYLRFGLEAGIFHAT